VGGRSRARRWVLAHAAAACVVALALLRAGDLLSWLTWRVSALFGHTAGSFFSFGVNADSIVGSMATGAVLFIVPLLILAMVAQATENLRHRLGRLALGVLPLAGVVAGVVTWWFMKAEDPDPLPSHVLGISAGVEFTVLSTVYWVILAATARVLANVRSQTDVA
jgi:hypothetical protein